MSQESIGRFFPRDQSVRTMEFLSQFGTQYFEEDERLQTWTRWMQNRLWTMQRLRKGRHVEDMVANSANSGSTLREDKALIESARRLIRPDKYRGDPSFWELPLQLSNKGNPNLPSVFVTEPRKHHFQFVGIPDGIREEMHVHSEKYDKVLQNWKNNPYHLNQQDKMKCNLDSIVPCRPQVSKLMIKGMGIYNIKKQQTHNIPSIKVYPASYFSSEEDNLIEVDEFQNKYSDTSLSVTREKTITEKIILKVNNVTVANTCEHAHKFSITFNTQVYETDHQVLVVENLSNVSVNYSWRKVSKYAKDGAHFFFDVSEGHFMPGQIVSFKISFRSKVPRIYHQDWRLKTSPKVSVLKVLLWGIATSTTSEVELWKYDKYLHSRVMECKEFEEQEILKKKEKMTAIPELPYRSLFLEHEVFEEINHGLHYRHNEVESLRQLFNEIVGEDEKWDMNVHNLREIILEKTSGDEQNTYVETFSNCCRTLMEIQTPPVAVDRKYSAVYSTFCVLANKIENEAQDLRNTMGLPQLSPGSFPIIRVPSISSSDVSQASRVSHHRAGSQSPSPAHKLSAIQEKSTSSEMEEEDEKTINDDPLLYESYLQILGLRVHQHIENTVEWAASAIDTVNFIQF